MVILNREGMLRVAEELAPPSVRVIWLVVPARALSKARDAVLPIVMKGMSVSAPDEAVPVMLPQEN